MKLQQKYFLSYLFFISLFSVFLAISFYVFFSVQARNDLRSSAENTFSQTATLLNYQFKQYLSTTYIVNNSEEVTNVHDIPQEEISDSIGVQYRESISLRNVMNRSIMSLTDVQMRLYVDDSFHSVLDHTMLENVSYLEQFPWYEEFMSGNTLTTWQQTSQVKKYSSEEIPSLSLFRKVDTTLSRGWVSELYISQERLQDILSKADPTGKGMVFLQSDDDVLLSSTDEELCQLFFQVSDNSFHRGTMDWEDITLDGKDYWIYSRPLSSTNWYLTLLLPCDTSYYAPDTLLKGTLLVLAAILVISLIAARLFTQGFSRRLLHLEEKMAALCAGNLDTRIEVEGKDEVTHLFQSFNHMAGEMKHLVQQQYENGIRVKNAELNALQAQINPHFLYNTLELINWKAMENDCTEIVEISQELARFYRLTLGSGHSMVPLRDEVEHISRYLSIQNFRFAQEIRAVIDVPEDCLSLFIPRLTLQPLVENSVLHGFLPREEASEGENIISLKAVKTENVLLLTLQDNGIGMTQDALDGILSEDRVDCGKHFGIMNIQQRLRMLYGKEYGLTYSAAPGQGVCVSIRLKADYHVSKQTGTGLA